MFALGFLLKPMTLGNHRVFVNVKLTLSISSCQLHSMTGGIHPRLCVAEAMVYLTKQSFKCLLACILFYKQKLHFLYSPPAWVQSCDIIPYIYTQPHNMPVQTKSNTRQWLQRGEQIFWQSKPEDVTEATEASGSFKNCFIQV